MVVLVEVHLRNLVMEILLQEHLLTMEPTAATAALLVVLVMLVQEETV